MCTLGTAVPFYMHFSSSHLQVKTTSFRSQTKPAHSHPSAISAPLFGRWRKTVFCLENENKFNQGLSQQPAEHVYVGIVTLLEGQLILPAWESWGKNIQELKFSVNRTRTHTHTHTPLCMWLISLSAFILIHANYSHNYTFVLCPIHV